MFVARHLRFNLRTLLIACAAFGAMMAYYLILAYRPRQAAAALTSRGINVYYARELNAAGEVANFWYVGGSLSYPKDPEPLRWYQTWLRCDLLERVTQIGSLDVDILSDDEWALVRCFPHLQELDASYSTITDDGLRHVSRLQHLTMLNLQGTKVIDAGLTHLRSLDQPQALALTNTRITPAGLEHLASLHALEILNLDHTALQGSDLVALASLHSLRYLNLWNTGVRPT